MSEHSLEGIHPFLPTHQHHVVGGAALEVGQASDVRIYVNGHILGGVNSNVNLTGEQTVIDGVNKLADR